MIPFQMVKNEFGQLRRVPWARDKSRAMLQIIRKAVADELNARDCQQAEAIGVGHMIKNGALQTCSCERGSNGGGTYIVNPLAAQVKHSGAEATDMVGKRWRAFCSESQADNFTPLEQPSTLREPGVYDEKLHRYVYPDSNEPQVEVANAAAVDVAEDKPATRKDEWTDKPKPKPNKGRPFGSKNKPQAGGLDVRGQLPQHN